MSNVRAETAHGLPGIKEPVLPPKLDIRPGDEQGESVDVWPITLGKPIPLEGPERPIEPEGSWERGWIAVVVLMVWGLWVILGGVRLVLTGDDSMLRAAPQIVMFPLGIVLGYYFAGVHQRSAEKPPRRPE